MEFVLASHNSKKLNELNEILGGLGIAVLPLPAAAPEAAEDGETFAANALIKARSAAAFTGMPAIADDSGLCVDALGGAPGVYSARYGSAAYCRRYGTPDGAPLSPDANDSDRTRLLLRNMEAVADGKRQAVFVSVIACVLPDGREFTAEGTCAGEITREMHGIGGFGYDPVFFVPAHQCTFAALTPAIKNRISHRANALKNFTTTLKQYMGD